jgi:hypothetical protein
MRDRAAQVASPIRHDCHQGKNSALSLVKSFQVKIPYHGKPVINRIGVIEYCGGMSPGLASALSPFECVIRQHAVNFPHRDVGQANRRRCCPA